MCSACSPDHVPNPYTALALYHSEVKGMPRKEALAVAAAQADYQVPSLTAALAVTLTVTLTVTLKCDPDCDSDCNLNRILALTMSVQS